MTGLIVEALAALTFGSVFAWALLGPYRGCGCDECVR